MHRATTTKARGKMHRATTTKAKGKTHRATERGKESRSGATTMSGPYLVAPSSDGDHGKVLPRRRMTTST